MMLTSKISKHVTTNADFFLKKEKTDESKFQLHLSGLTGLMRKKAHTKRQVSFFPSWKGNDIDDDDEEEELETK